MVRVIASQLIVAIYLDTGFGQEGLKGLKIFVRKAGAAVPHQHLGAAVAYAFSPDFIFAACYRNYSDAGLTDVARIQSISQRQEFSTRRANIRRGDYYGHSGAAAIKVTPVTRNIIEPF
ncbi:hypothetical protein ACO0LO_17025 [Undibacterium sp. TJN25]|uniref:hypothetical protein n=1 Tax=Undibacterium sp. TJN25 TaxID=3413056 RepID=UPI003BF3767F